MLGKKIREWLAGLADGDKAKEAGIYRAINCKNTFTDNTCIKANIHFPVDWVLLRDAVRSLILSIQTIRAHGLKHRMIEPQVFLRQMNKLCICMTHTRRKTDSKKQRKIIFREMKKINSCVAKHGKRYRVLLNNKWQETDLSYMRAQQIIHRIDAILEQLPMAIKQAHERIIGERIVPNEKKILSFYDRDARVIVRGKAGNEVEFGQGLLLTEQIDGLIIDWRLFADQPLCDSKLLKPTLIRLENHYRAIESSCADRAFSAQQNDIFLQKHKIYNAICPRSPKQFQKKLSDPRFLSLQTRRSQTEARIGIFKNVFLGKPLHSKITAYKKTAITWCVLTHNLWLLSRKAIDIERSMLKKVA